MSIITFKKINYPPYFTAREIELNFYMNFKVVIVIWPIWNVFPLIHTLLSFIPTEIGQILLKFIIMSNNVMNKYLYRLT